MLVRPERSLVEALLARRARCSGPSGFSRTESSEEEGREEAPEADGVLRSFEAGPLRFLTVELPVEPHVHRHLRFWRHRLP